MLDEKMDRKKQNKKEEEFVQKFFRCITIGILTSLFPFENEQIWQGKRGLFCFDRFCCHVPFHLVNYQKDLTKTLTCSVFFIVVCVELLALGYCLAFSAFSK
jgi:hypothetical protein